MKKFLIIDDHGIVRSSLRNVLIDLYESCEIDEAFDEQTVLALLKEKLFDLIILDVHIPGLDTIKLMEYIKATHPQFKVLIFSMSAEYIYARRFIKAGAMGYVSKTSELSELKKAIDRVLQDRIYLSENLANLLADEGLGKSNGNPFQLLSIRESSIASLLIKGEAVGEIAVSLNINISSVGTYKARLFKKLKVQNISELIALGRVYEYKPAD